MSSQETTRLPSSSSHRLPTVSASQALHTLKSQGPRAVSTSHTHLDRILSPHGFGGTPVGNTRGGFTRGQVSEVYGPPGVGKTTLAAQAAVNALHAGEHVLWIDAAAPLVARRVNELLLASTKGSSPSKNIATASSQSELEIQYRFHHYNTPTLAHLLAMIIHPPPSFPPADTSLIIIDSLSTLFDNAYPRHVDDRAARKKSDNARWAAGRKFAVMNELISKLGKMAAMHDIAIVFTCQTITRIRPGSGALLLPAISGTEWENGISTRLVLFRDWVPAQGKWTESDHDRLRRARFVGVVKSNGVVLAEADGVGVVVPFTIEQVGIRELNIASVDITAPANVSPVRPPKRRFAEIADSDDEDAGADELYGWVEDDELAAEGLIVDERALGGNAGPAEPQTGIAAEKIDPSPVLPG